MIIKHTKQPVTLLTYKKYLKGGQIFPQILQLNYTKVIAVVISTHIIIQ